MQGKVTLPIMTGLNSAAEWSPESSEVLKKKKTGNTVENLLKEGIFREFGQPIQPEKFDTYKAKRDEYHNKVRTHMNDLRRENSTEWDTIKEADIATNSWDNIIGERILRMAIDLVFMRKRTHDRALELFPNIRTQRADWSTILSTSLSDLDEDELKNYASRTHLMRKLVYKTFPGLQWENPSEKRDFEQIFYDKNMYLTTPEQKSRFRGIHKNYHEFNQVPDGSDIDFILGVYQGASNDRKKEVLSALWASITIKHANDTGLIPPDFLRLFAEKEMGKWYTSLMPDQQDSFIRGLEASTTYMIAASDFDATKIGTIIANDTARRKLSQEIFRTIVIDAPESIDPRWTDILGNIKRQKQAEARKRWEEYDDTWDRYEGFIDSLTTGLRTADGGTSIENIDLLKTSNPVIRFQDSKWGAQFMRIKKVRDADGNPIEVGDNHGYGVELEWLPVDGGALRSSQHFSLSYDDLAASLKKMKWASMMTSTEFNSLLEEDQEVAENSNGTKFYDARPTIDAEPVTAANIATKLNVIDDTWRGFGFEPGTSFIAPSTEIGTGKKESNEIWQVREIVGDTVSFMAGNGYILRNQKISDVYAVLSETPGFTRIGKVDTDKEMTDQLKEFGLGTAWELNDGQLIVKEKDDHGHEIEKKITCFESKKWGHIRMEYIKWGIVRFGEFDENGNTIEEIKAYAKKHWADKKLKKLYKWRTMSYPAFLRYLQEQELEATTKDLIVPEASHDLHGDHHEHAHMTGSFFGRMMKWQNPASIWKWLEMVYHGIEHTLEKWAKLDAARFAMGTAKFLKLDETSVGAQIYADITNGSKEIVQKIEDKLFGIPGPAGRLKAIHIAHNRDGRPEEVVAAMNYMLKNYGHFYAEDVKHYQSKVTQHNIETADPGYFAFLDGFIITSKIGNLNFWRKKAYKKAIEEMGSMDDHENEPTEEQLMHALTKIIDGNWSDYPYAAGVVKAIGWPGGFEKTWKFEGFDNAHKKWKDQTQMVSAQWRLNKWVWYFNTHEIYKAMGAMEAVAGKIKSPEFQAMPFIWACGWYSRHASHTALQKLKWYAWWGMSFHAFSFLRNEESNTLYRNTVRLALHDLAKQGRVSANAVSEFDSICDRMLNGPEDKKITDGKYKWETPATAMMKFWQANQGRWLHDMLQGQNGWLVKRAWNKNVTVKWYQDKLTEWHSEMLKNPSIPGSDFGKDWFDEHGYQNILLARWENGLNSMNSMLNKIKFSGYSGWWKPMDQESKEKIWAYVIKTMDALRDEKYFDGDVTLQRAQYLAYRREIIHYFQEQIGARTDKWGGTTPEQKKQFATSLIDNSEYFQEMKKMGIDPYGIFSADTERTNTESDYQSWKSGGSTTTLSTKHATDIRAEVTGKAEKIRLDKTPPNFVPPKKTWGKIWPKKGDPNPDSDGSNPGGASQIDDSWGLGDPDSHGSDSSDSGGH